jgi:DNA helicase II / ATP-dependent DNA helicase PcrA
MEFLMDFIDTLADKYNICLNEQQQRAVLHRNGAALVLAGPGSGKTTVLTARTLYLCLVAGVQPYQILSVTYSRASACNMKERFNSLYGDLVDKAVHFSTIHSFANKVIMNYEKQQGHTFNRLTDSSSGETEQSILQKIYLQVNKIRISEDEMESLTQAIGLVKNKMLKGPETLEDCEVPNFITIYNAYEEYKGYINNFV